MTSFQPLYRRFYETIHLSDAKLAELRQKRDRIMTRLQSNLPTTFTWFNQGSYEMGTGIKPINGDYDMDIGMVFTLDHRTNTPVTVKGWVYKAVAEHTARVEWRRPCITVYYQEAKEVIYHVDLAVLAKDPGNQLRLAIGKENAAPPDQEWQIDDRQRFTEDFANRFSGEDAGQMRRVICYLKRWKDEHFPSEGRSAPTGLALTVAAYQWFQPAKTGTSYDDHGATEALVRAILQRFSQTWDRGSGGYIPRLSLQFPRAPQDDVLGRMSNEQMKQFHQRLEKLRASLEEARTKGAVAPLRSAFGSDFPEK